MKPKWAKGKKIFFFFFFFWHRKKFSHEFSKGVEIKWRRKTEGCDRSNFTEKSPYEISWNFFSPEIFFFFTSPSHSNFRRGNIRFRFSHRKRYSSKKKNFYFQKIFLEFSRLPSTKWRQVGRHLSSPIACQRL
jgi:hypothetical protein